MVRESADGAELLRPELSPMPFRARAGERAVLEEWRDDPSAGPVMLLGGAAGVGKSRLVLQFGKMTVQPSAGPGRAARRARALWISGWLHPGTGAAAIATAAAAGRPVLILVDDADGSRDVIPLLTTLAEWHGDPVIKVILVARSAEGLRESLARRLNDRTATIITRATSLTVEPEGSPDDLARWFGEAVTGYAEAFGQPVPVLPEVTPEATWRPGTPFS